MLLMVRAVRQFRYTLRVPSLDFFIGKGGVGKTTVSSAYACVQAAKGRRVLLLSTDPAHSLFDVFGLRSAREKQRVRVGRHSLDVWQLRAEREFNDFVDKYRDAVIEVLASGTIFSRGEVAPFLETTIPGMAEVAALLLLADLLDGKEYERIVVDTAPMGHTLRLFELPESFLKLLRFLQIAASRDRVLAERFAGTRVAGPAFLSEWERRAAEIRDALAGPDSRIVLVTTPEEFALNESARAKNSLARMEPPLSVSDVVLNRAVRRSSECQRCREAAKRTVAGEKFLARGFAEADVRIGEDVGAPIAGAPALLAFGEHVFAGKKLKLGIKPVRAPEIEFEEADWPVVETPLTLTIGKGGVGKTTISAGLGWVTRNPHPLAPKAGARRMGHPSVILCSTDPAPSLDDVFRQEIGDEPIAVLDDPDLQAMEINAAEQFRRWAQEMKDGLAEAFGGSAGGLHVDLTFEREMVSALLDMAPPGIDELSATFRITELLGDGRDARATTAGKVILDMAPTGHALELLRMPERIQLWTRLILRALAPHRQLKMAQDAAVEVARVGQESRRLATILKDRSQAQAAVVMLAEPMPDRETARLLRALDKLGVHRGQIFVNRVLRDGGGCPRCEMRARFQRATLARLRREYSGTLLAVEEEATPVAGAAALKKLTRKIWRVV